MVTETTVQQAIAVALAGEGHPAELLAALRGAERLLVPRREPSSTDGEDLAVDLVPAADAHWLVVCTSETELAAFTRAAAGGDEPLPHRVLSGDQLLDDLLAQLPGVGLCLDPASHGLTVPDALVHNDLNEQEVSA